MNRFDFTPYRRSTVGFDRLFDLLEGQARQNAGDNYPPFNIERLGSDAYRIGMQLMLSSDLLIMVSPALIAPELNARPAALKALKIAEPAVRRDASLIYPSDRPLTPAAGMLLDEVRRVAKEHYG